MKSVKMGYSNNKFNIFTLWNNIILYFILIVTFTFYNKDLFNKYNGEKSNIGASFNFGNNRSLAEYYNNKDGYNVLRVNLDHKNLKDVLGNMHPEIKMVEVDSESVCPGTNEVNLKVVTNIPPDMIKVNATSENMSVGQWDYIMQYYGQSTPKEVSKLDSEVKDKIEKKIKKKKRKTPLIRYIAELVGYGIILIPGFPVLVGIVSVGFCILIFMGKKSAKNYFSTIKKWLF